MRVNDKEVLLLDVLRTAQHVSGVRMPIIRSSTTAVAASGLPMERVGRNSRNNTSALNCVILFK